MTRISRLLTTAGAFIHTALETIRDRALQEARRNDDRGDVVSTVIIVAGFAALAVTVYLAVRGKVSGWIEKIPSGTSR